MGFWNNPLVLTVLGGLLVALLVGTFVQWWRRVRLVVKLGPPRDFPVPDVALESVDLPFIRLTLTVRSRHMPEEVTVQARTHPERIPLRVFRPLTDAEGGGQLQPGTVQPLKVEFPHRGWSEDLFVSRLELQDFVGNQATRARFTFLTVTRSRRQNYRIEVNFDTGACRLWRWRP